MASTQISVLLKLRLAGHGTTGSSGRWPFSSASTGHAPLPCNDLSISSFQVHRRATRLGTIEARSRPLMLTRIDAFHDHIPHTRPDIAEPLKIIRIAGRLSKIQICRSMRRWLKEAHEMRRKHIAFAILISQPVVLIVRLCLLASSSSNHVATEDRHETKQMVAAKGK